MTTQEFLDQFDVFYNSVSSNQSPPLDEYEISVCLTQAQNDLISAYFNNRKNKIGQGFDDSKERQIDFSTLIKTKIITADSFKVAYYDSKTNTKGFNLPNDAIAIINEQAIVKRDNNTCVLNVIPLSFSEYDITLNKPYNRPLKNQAWRIITENNYSEVIIGFNDYLSQYKIRYVSKPTPIIVSNLPKGRQIDGISDKTECALPEPLHRDILMRAVEIAKATYGGDLNTQIAVGGISQTELGGTPNE